jgi:outer membrane immunogenic protein
MNLRTLSLAFAFVFLGGSAFAGDIPEREPFSYGPPPPIFTWTGFYVGLQVGYEWGQPSMELVSSTAGTVRGESVNASGVVGGGHVGYNYQINQFVVGVEGDVNGSSSSGRSADGWATAANPVDGSIRGRLGYTWDRALLVYATGGVAFRPDNVFYHTSSGEDSDNGTRVGWTVGAGIEYALTENWSVRVEYRYTDYGQTSLPLINSEPAAPGLFTFRVNQADNRIQAGISYKLDLFAPPAAAVPKF